MPHPPREQSNPHTPPTNPQKRSPPARRTPPPLVLRRTARKEATSRRTPPARRRAASAGSQHANLSVCSSKTVQTYFMGAQLTRRRRETHRRLHQPAGPSRSASSRAQQQRDRQPFHPHPRPREREQRTRERQRDRAVYLGPVESTRRSTRRQDATATRGAASCSRWARRVHGRRLGAAELASRRPQPAGPYRLPGTRGSSFRDPPPPQEALFPGLASVKWSVLTLMVGIVHTGGDNPGERFWFSIRITLRNARLVGIRFRVEGAPEEVGLGGGAEKKRRDGGFWGLG